MQYLTLISVWIFLVSVCIGKQPDKMWTYKTVGEKSLQMSVFLPEGYETTDKKFPSIVWFHGGSWNAGEANWHYPDCEYWSNRGMVAVSVDYRLRDRDKVQVPLDCVKDAKAAISYLRQNAKALKIDPNRIVAAGGSAGGQLAAATSMIRSNETIDDPAQAKNSIPNAVILTNPWFKCARSLSPPEHIQPNLPPTITFIGDQDPGLTVASMRQFNQALINAGNASEIHIGKGGKHGFCNGRNPNNPFFNWSLELSDRFLVKHGILTGESIVKAPKGVKPVPLFKQGGRMLFIGDSITDMNWGRNEKDRNHYLGHSFVFLLAGRLGVDHPEAKLDFYNRGISGNTVAQLKARWQKDAIDMKPDVLTILVGTNDVGRNVTPSAFEANYRNILTQSRKANPQLRIILLDPFVLKSGRLASGDAWNKRRTATDALRPIVAKLARDFGALHIPTQDIFDTAAKLTSPDHWIWDGVHPLPQGHELIARNWLNYYTERWPKTH